MMYFTGEDKELEAVRQCEAAVESTGIAHSVIAASKSALAVVPASHAGARALETIRPIVNKYSTQTAA